MNNIWSNKWILGLIIVLIITNALFTGMLWMKNQKYSPQGHPPPPAQRHALLPAILQFDSAQDIKFRAFSKPHFAKMDTLKSMEFMLREKLLAAMDAAVLDTLKMHELSQQLGNIQQQIQEQTLFHFREVKSVCRSEQVEKLKELLHRSIMRDIGPARILRLMPEKTRDSIMQQHPDMRPEKFQKPQDRPGMGEQDNQDEFPPHPQHHRPGPPPHDGHHPDGPPPPHHRRHPNGPPPPPEDDMHPPGEPF